jgi:hypothetical protein
MVFEKGNLDLKKSIFGAVTSGLKTNTCKSFFLLSFFLLSSQNKSLLIVVSLSVHFPRGFLSRFGLAGPPFSQWEGGGGGCD